MPQAAREAIPDAGILLSAVIQAERLTEISSAATREEAYKPRSPGNGPSRARAAALAAALELARLSNAAKVIRSP